MSRIKELCKSLNVVSVSLAPLKAGALVYEDCNSFHIVLSSQLSEPKRLFALLHELGHLALGIIHKDPADNHNIDEELKVNLWAINVFNELYPETNKNQLRQAFRISEHAGYESVEKSFTHLNIEIEELI